MGGLIDWAAVPIVAAMLGVEDVERWLLQMIEIREFQRVTHGK